MSLLRVNIIKPFYALKSVNAGSNPVLFGRIKSRIRIRNADFVAVFRIRIRIKICLLVRTDEDPDPGGKKA